MRILNILLARHYADNITSFVNLILINRPCKYYHKHRNASSKLKHFACRCAFINNRRILTMTIY